MRESMERRATTLVKFDTHITGKLKSVNSDTVKENSHKINAVVRTDRIYHSYY